MRNFFKILSLSFLFLTIGFFAKAQVSTTDTVCAGSLGKIYKVNKTAGSTYTWLITNGTQATGGTSDSITVNWNTGVSTGLVRVVEKNAAGCPGDTQTMNIVIVPQATAALTGGDTICTNKSPNLNKLKVTLTGAVPITYTYTVNGGSTITVTTSSLTGYINLAGPYTTDQLVKLTSVKDKYNKCAGAVSSTNLSATIKVLPKPATSAIFHY
jgi:hypothetical protein